MAYGLKYIREYSNRHDELCRLEFWFKDYVGSSKQVLGSRDSFILSKELDDPLEPIQAQPANVELLAEGAINFSIDDFYSEDDEYVLCKFYISPIGGIQRTVVSSGTLDIQFVRSGNNNLIYLPIGFAIQVGQQLFIAGQFYTVLTVNNDFADILIVQVAEPVVTRTLPNAAYTVYDIQTKKLIYTGYVLQDETEDAFISYDHFIKLTLTDNLGLLQDVTFGVACGALDPFQHFTIAQYFSIILSATGLQLPIQILANLYETTTVTRTTDAAATFADQIRLNSAMFADDNGVWKSCYEILSAILKAFNCTVCQRWGAWVIYRWAELPALDNAPFIGTQFSYDLASKTAISLLNKPVVISESGINVLTGGADNVLSATRPYKYIKDTFDYKQPAQLLKDEDLKDVGVLRATTFSSDGKIRYDDYEMPWYITHENSAPNGLDVDVSFIRVTTDIATNTETERAIITPYTDSTYKWLSFQQIEVSAGDALDFSAEIKALSASSNPLRVNFRFSLFVIDANGNTILYVLSPFTGTDTTFGRYSWVFEGNTGAQNYKTFLGIPYDFSGTITDYQSFSLSSTLADKWVLPSFPADGILIVSWNGANNTSDGNIVAHRDTAMKDINLDIKNRINDSYDVNGQTHTYTQNGTIKNKNEQDIIIDDSPRLSIAGTLVVDKLTHFNYINIDAYMQKTLFWQRTPGEHKRLGEITTEELKQLYGYLRYKLDCTILYTEAIDNLTTFQLPILHGSNFRMAAISSINYADCVCKCVLIEMWKSGESKADASYQFEYLYEKS
jgi:hypothetical protein